MKLIERIATQKKTKSEISAVSPLPDHEPGWIAPENCTCEKPQPRWRSIDGQIFCAICTRIPSRDMLDEFLHLPQSVPAGFENSWKRNWGPSPYPAEDARLDAEEWQRLQGEPDVIYEPLQRSVLWNQNSIARCVMGLPPETDAEISARASAAKYDADRAAPLDPELAAWALSLTAADLPAEPWQFSRSSEIRSNVLWLASLQSDVRLGSDSPKAKTGALQRRLGELRRILQKGKP